MKDDRFDKASGLWYRDDVDLRIIRSVERDYAELLARVSPGDGFLDLGAHLGATSRLALDRGAAVMAVEPEPDNFRLLCKNTNPFAYTGAICAAAGYEGTVRLHLNAKSCRHAVAPEGIEVPGIPAYDLMAYRPDFLKCDIEGSEYVLFEALSDEDIRSLRAVAVEFHFQNDDERQQARDLASRLDRLGAATKTPRLHTRFTATVGVWDITAEAQ